jgi:hypothetical protein
MLDSEIAEAKRVHDVELVTRIWPMLTHLGHVCDNELLVGAGGPADLFTRHEDGRSYWVQLKNRKPANIASPFITIKSKTMMRYLHFEVEAYAPFILVSLEDMRCDYIQHCYANATEHVLDRYFWVPTRPHFDVWEEKEPMRYAVPDFFA